MISTNRASTTDQIYGSYSLKIFSVYDKVARTRSPIYPMCLLVDIFCLEVFSLTLRSYYEKRCT